MIYGHSVYLGDGEELYTCQVSPHTRAVTIATSFPASQEHVNMLMAMDTSTGDGRSPFNWYRLTNGDLILGTAPQGEGYFAMENCVADDYEKART